MSELVNRPASPKPDIKLYEHLMEKERMNAGLVTFECLKLRLSYY